MNNIQLKIRVDALESSYTTNATLVVNGTCSFQFYSKEENQVRHLKFTAYGQSAVTLLAGVNSIHIISGRLNVYKPTEQNPNHQALLSIDWASCLQQGTNNIVPLRKQNAPKTQTPAVPQNHQQVAEVDLDKVPF